MFASEWLVCAALAYLLWLPVSAGSIQYPVLAVMTLACIHASVVRGLVPTPRILLAWLLSAVLAVGAALVGSIHQTLGLGQQSAQWFGALVIWGAFANALSPVLARAVMRVVVVGVGLCSLVILLYIGTQYGLPQILPAGVLSSQGAGATTIGGVAIRWYGLSTLAAGAPIVTAALFFGRSELLPRRWIVVVSAALAIVAAAMSGRRAILLVTVFAPITLLVFRAIADRRGRGARRIPLPIALLVLLLPVLLLGTWNSSVGGKIRDSLSAVSATYLGSGEGSSNATKAAGDVHRVNEAQQMLDRWGDSPVIGNGLGSTVPGYSRNAKMPWQFELQYHQLLMVGGLVGFTLFVVALLVGFGEIVRVYRRNPRWHAVIASAIVGAASLLFSNASNPYLQAVGHGWGLALPVGLALAAGRDPDGAAEPAEPQESALRRSRLTTTAITE